MKDSKLLFLSLSPLPSSFFPLPLHRLPLAQSSVDITSSSLLRLGYVLVITLVDTPIILYMLVFDLLLKTVNNLKLLLSMIDIIFRILSVFVVADFILSFG
jgi:hypothetical protein